MNEQANLQSVAAPKALEILTDPELLALPAPPRRERTLAVVLMLTTTLASLAMCWALKSEVAYAFARPVPVDVGDLATLQLGTIPPGTYVEARGLLGTSGAIRYTRPLEGDSFRVHPVAGVQHGRLWIEIRVPEGMEGPRFVPPTSFAGRLTPLAETGLRHAGLAGSIRRQTATEVSKDAWVLVDGASPRASRWAVALFALFAFFAFWNVTNTVRVLRRIHDR